MKKFIFCLACLPVFILSCKNNPFKDHKKPIEDAAKISIQKAVQPVQLNYTQTAAYTEASSDNDNYVFYDVPAEQFNKTKVGGFLKKVKRIVERTNPISRLLEGNEEQVVAKKL